MKPLAGRSLLVADTNAVGLGRWRERLLGQGARVICSSSIDSALANAITFPAGTFDAAVIEHRPPRLDGVELAAAIRALPSMKNLQVIVVTVAEIDCATVARPDSTRGAVMTRPVSIEQLTDQLSRMFAQSPVPTPRAGAASSRSAAYRGTILVAEDDPVNAEILRAMLNALGLQVVQAGNGEQAAACAAEQSFDLLLIDGQMPVMDGLAATRLIRARERAAGDSARRTIIGVTANEAAEYRAQCTAAGMDDFVTKPVSMQALLALLASWLPAPVSQVSVPRVPAVSLATIPSVLSGRFEPVTPNRAIDWSQVESLRSVAPGDGNGLVGRAIGLYVHHAPKLIEEILTYRVTWDLKDVMRAAHSLKSSSASLGAHRVAGLSKTIELAAAKGDFEIIDSTIAALEFEYRRAETELRKAVA